MFLFQKGQTIANRYSVVFPHKEGAYAETYRVKDSSSAHNNATMAGAVNEFQTKFFQRYLRIPMKETKTMVKPSQSSSIRLGNKSLVN